MNQQVFAVQFSAAVRALQSGQLDRAENLVRTILEAAPDHFEANHLRGIILFQKGDVATAIETLERAAALRPDHAQIRSDLGMMCHAAGQFARAQTHLEKALEREPANAAAHLNLGNVYLDRGRHLQAERHYREALKLQPRLGAALNNLSRLLLDNGRAAEAAGLARDLIDLAPQSALGHSRLGAALDRLGQIDASIMAHEKAVSLAPNDAETRLIFADSLAAFGRMDQAIAQLEQAIAAAPTNGELHLRLAGLKHYEVTDECLARLTGLAANESASTASRANAAFALGQVHEKRKAYDRAFKTFTSANALMAQGLDYDPQSFDQFADALLSAPLLEPAPLKSATPVPVFIIGLPRSGTTLTEQVLCAHPGVKSAGEPTILQFLLDRLMREKSATSITDLAHRLTPTDLEKLGEDYLALLKEYGPQATHLIDKVPGNFLMLGLIRAALPQAKVVHCERHLADTCLSIFKNRFSAGMQIYSYDLDHLARYAATYRRAMDHWQSELPGFIHSIAYEDLVTDQEAISRALYAHCGLSWTNDALEFFKAARPVHTVSMSQVRQPLHSGSKGIAARYGDAAQPLRDALARVGLNPNG